jgi:hypothetical protein
MMARAIFSLRVEHILEIKIGLFILSASLIFTTKALAIGDFGPDTCMEGFVWREACGPADRVCVPPRAETKRGKIMSPVQVGSSPEAVLRGPIPAVKGSSGGRHATLTTMSV